MTSPTVRVARRAGSETKCAASGAFSTFYALTIERSTMRAVAHGRRFRLQSWDIGWGKRKSLST